MHQILDVPDGRLGFDDTGGEGRLVVAAPGMGDTRHVYRHFAPEAVARGLRLATIDVRGMGDSSTGWPDHSDAAIGADMLALVHHLGGAPAILVGNSLTAASAVLAAVQDPNAVAGIVLIGPFARDVPTPAWQQAVFRALLTPPWGKSAWVAYYRSQLYPGVKPPDHDDYVARLRTNLSEPGRFSSFRALAFNSHAQSEAKLPDVGCPALVIMGSADPDFPDPAAEAEALGEVLDAQVVMIEGAGHYPQAQAPDEVADAVAAFADRIDGASTS